MYRLYDVYDGFSNRILIGEFETLREVRRAALQWGKEETDGECDLALYCRRDDGKYYLFADWSY